MKNKLNQKQRIINQLLKEGFITRNSCIRNYITRLSAYILDLKNEGWEFETIDNGKDYIYKVSKCPYQIRTLTLANGEKIQQIIK